MRADRWFHTLVVVGASLSGCGRTQSSDESESIEPSSAGTAAGGAAVVGGGAAGGGGTAGTTAETGGAAGSAGRAPLGPWDCENWAHFACTSYDPLTDCACDTERPMYQDDCEQRLDFQCLELTLNGNVQYAACYCERPELTPQDCAVPESFRCNITYPALSDCHCDGEVVQESDCSPGSVLCCQSKEPRFGCECCSLVIK